MKPEACVTRFIFEFAPKQSSGRLQNVFSRCGRFGLPMKLSASYRSKIKRKRIYKMPAWPSLSQGKSRKSGGWRKSNW